MNDIEIDVIGRDAAFRDSLSGLLVSFPKADSCQDKRTLVVYTVEDPGFAPGRGEGLRSPLTAKRVPRKKKRESPILHVKWPLWRFGAL